MTSHPANHVLLLTRIEVSIWDRSGHLYEGYRSKCLGEPG
jgi:hypothetical protein